MPGDREPETGAAEFARRRSVGLGKCAKKLLLGLWRDSHAGITDFKPQLAFLLLFHVTGDAHGDLANIGKFNRVPHEVSQHLADPPRVAAEPRRDKGSIRPASSISFSWQREASSSRVPSNRLCKLKSDASIVILPASIFEKSRTSLITVRRDSPLDK